jgi:hypothetical protein
LEVDCFEEEIVFLYEDNELDEVGWNKNEENEVIYKSEDDFISEDDYMGRHKENYNCLHSGENYLIEIISSILYFTIFTRILFGVFVNYWYYQFLRCNALVKFKVSVIHFALTARSLFAAMVSHHDNYIHHHIRICWTDTFERIWQYKFYLVDYFFDQGVNWKVKTTDISFAITARTIFATMVSHHNNYLKYLLFSWNSLLLILVSIILFALTARTLFAAKVAHHNHYIYDWLQEKIQKNRVYLCWKEVSWKKEMIDFREVLTQDDGEFDSLEMWKINSFYFKEILSHIDKESLGLVCRFVILTFAMMGSVTHWCLFWIVHCYVRINTKQWVNVVCARINGCLQSARESSLKMNPKRGFWSILYGDFHRRVDVFYTCPEVFAAVHKQMQKQLEQLEF